MINIELKTKVANRAKILKKIRDIGATLKDKMNQSDYYFKNSTTKEKIREINNKTIQYISYKRPEKNGRKLSNYSIKKLSQKQKSSYIKSKSKLCIVNKVRHLWIYKHTRIHFDRVFGLGDFLELETVLNKISRRQGLTEFREVVKLLEIDTNDTEPSSYSNLILHQNKKAKTHATKPLEDFFTPLKSKP